MSLRPRREIANLRTCQHGGINYAELREQGIKPEEVLDFSVCTNPFMPPPGIRESLSSIPIEQYPDSSATELRERLSERLGVPTENIIMGSGTTELIRLITMTYFRKKDSVLFLRPTYGEYEIACRIAGVRPLRHQSKEEDSFVPAMAEITDLIQEHLSRAIFICNPNNPTGKYLSRRDIETVMAASEESLLVLDEAYVTFVEKRWNSIDLTKFGNVVVLRSMTKDYGLPGLRLGYAVASREIIRSLQRVVPPWNVNIIAQKVGLAVLKQEEYLRQSLLQTREAKRFLTREFSRLGFKALPSDANYFVVKVGNARKFRNSLLKHGILVRDCTSFGMPQYIRIGPRTLPDCEKLISAIGSVLHSGEDHR